MRPIRQLWQRSIAFAVILLAPWFTHAAEPDIAGALQPFVDSGTLAGAVTLVASPDKVLSLQAVGYADVEAKTPMKTDNLFWIASMSKPITAAALMMLVDEGKVQIDDPVEKHLPEFRGQMVLRETIPERTVLSKPGHPMTVKEALSHTSGLPFMSPFEQSRGPIDSLPLQAATLTYALGPLKTEPGTKYDYSNAGINTAGRIIEVVSGMPYEQFLQQRLFDPLGMKDTTFLLTPAQVERLAKSYKPGPNNTGLEVKPIDPLSQPLTRPDRYPCPGGGLFSTAADCAAFCQMVLGGGMRDGRRYLSEAAVRQMTSTQTGKLLDVQNGEGGYGLGWQTSRKFPGPDGPVIPGSCGHGGAYSTNMSIDPERRLITVYMVQHAGYPKGMTAGRVHSAFAGQSGRQTRLVSRFGVARIEAACRWLMAAIGFYCRCELSIALVCDPAFSSRRRSDGRWDLSGATIRHPGRHHRTRPATGAQPLRAAKLAPGDRSPAGTAVASWPARPVGLYRLRGSRGHAAGVGHRPVRISGWRISSGPTWKALEQANQPGRLNARLPRSKSAERAIRLAC